MYKVDVPVKKKPIKKPKPVKPSAIEQRMVVGKGIRPGIYDTEVVIRDDRDKGRLVSLLYSDITDTPRVSVSIRVKDDISDEEAVVRWDKKHGKTSWRLA